MGFSRLTLGFIASALLLSGCITQSGGTAEPATSATTPVTASTSVSTTSPTQKTTPTSTWTTSTRTTSTTLVEAQAECVQPPKPGCECVQWVCSSTPTTTLTVTSTTCATIPYPEYNPRARYVDILIKGDRFKPDEVEVFIGDTVIANITNRQGLHRIRETYSNRTVILPPGESHELIFYAADEGTYLLTCNPYCEKPMEAVILVSKPYVKVC